MIDADRMIQPEATNEDEVIDRAIRPRKLEDYTGQEHVVEQLGIYIEAARGRDDALDHVLIFGPRAWVKLRWRILSLMKWTSRLKPRRGRCWKKLATWLRC